MSEAIVVARKAAGAWCKSLGFPTTHRENDMPDAIVQAFEDGGLLVTDLHKRALEACENYSKAWRNFTFTAPENIEVDAVGRESLAARKPKPRWRVADCRVEDTVGKRFLDGLNGEQARAVADALNALEAQP